MGRRTTGSLARPLAALAAVGAAGVAWEAGRRRHAARLGHDPEAHILDDPVRGEAVAVASADGTKLHVEVCGPEDAPPVVLIHGWGMGQRFWHYQRRDLRTDHRVISYDLRGHGESDVPASGRYNLHALADDLEAVLAACVRQGERPLLAGHSLGGMTILSWGRWRRSVLRDRIAGAVLLNTACSDLAAGMFAGLAVTEKVASALGRHALAARVPAPRSTPITHGLVRRVALSPAAAPAHVTLTEQLFFDCPVDVRAGFGLELGRLDLCDAAAGFDAPTLVVAGGRDRLIPRSLSRDLADRLSDTCHVELSGCGHQSPLERHHEVTSRLREFTRLHAHGRTA